MLRILQPGNFYPLQYPVDPTAVFEAGMIGQLTLMGNNIVCGVSDGTAPLGIIDDSRTSAFYAPVIDEVKIIPVVTEKIGDKYFTLIDTLALLNNSNIVSSSFLSNIKVVLNSKNGAVTVLAGTEANYDADGDGIPDSIYLLCNYRYQIPGIPGDDTTAGTGKITIWNCASVLFETDVYDVSARYTLNCNLFVNQEGKLTSHQTNEYYYPVAMLTAPPSISTPTIQAIWW